MSKIQYDKKQLPQVIVLAVLSVGLFSYFAYRIITPPPSEAGPAPTPAKTVAVAPAAASGVAPVGATQVASAGVGPADVVDPNTVPVIDSPPMPGMHDPFIAPAFTADPSAIKATDPRVVVPPTVSALPPPTRIAKMPSFSTIAPLPTAPPLPGGLKGAAPAPIVKAPDVDPGPAGWVVTGVLGSDDDPGGRIACLRNGELHRFVRAGGSIDGDFQVVSINRDSVVLRKAEKVYRLNLGNQLMPAHSSMPNSAPSGTSLPVPAAADKTVPAVSPHKHGIINPFA